MSPRPLRWALRFAAIALAVTGCARRQNPDATPSIPSADAAATPRTVVPALAASVSGAPPSPKADANAAQVGQELYARYCALCHGPNATGYAADNAPSLVSRTFLESASDAFIAESIRVGRSNTPMAAYGVDRGGPLTNAQIDAIVAFLRSKGPTPIALPKVAPSGDARRGAKLYEQRCRVCHGSPDKRGTAPALHNPEFLNQASPEFLRHAIVHGRPSTPMPAFGGKLQKQQIEDILTWLGSLAADTKPPATVQNPHVPDNLPLVINPNGGHPKFTLRDGRYVSAEQVKQALEAKKRMVIIDARSPSDWIQFHIPGAVPLPYYDTEQLKRVPNDGTWVIAYCACPHHASGEVVNALRRLNYPNTAVLDEGILVWRDRGYPLAGEAVKGSAPKKR